MILLKRSEEEKKKRSPGKLQHDAREALRCHTWKYAEKNRLVGHFDRGEDKQIPRRDMQGIGAGVEYRIVTSIVDAEKDPYRRTLMRSIIAGAILTEERLYREKTRKLPGPAPTSAEEREGPYAGKCTTCGEGVETMEHLWWQCSRYSDIRAERRYLDVVLLSRDDWPACMGCGLLPIGLKLHSLLGNKELMESLLSMYVDIVIRRMDIQLQREEKRLWPYCQAAQDEVRQIRSEGRVVTLRHVRRCFNKEADSLSNVAMDRPEEEADLRLLLSESGGTAASTQSTTDGNAVLTVNGSQLTTVETGEIILGDVSP